MSTVAKRKSHHSLIDDRHLFFTLHVHFGVYDGLTQNVARITLPRLVSYDPANRRTCGSDE